MEKSHEEAAAEPDDLAVQPLELEAARPDEATVAGNDFSGPDCATSPGYSCGYPRTCGGTSCDAGYPVCYQCAGRCEG